MNIIIPINVKCQHLLNVGILTFISRIKTTSESSKARNIIIFQHFSFDDQMEFHAMLNWNKVFKFDQDHTVNP